MLSLRGAVRVFSGLSLPKTIVVHCSLWSRRGEKCHSQSASQRPLAAASITGWVFFTSRCIFHLSRTNTVWKSGKEPPPKPLTPTSVCCKAILCTWTTRMLLSPNISVHLRILLCIWWDCWRRKRKAGQSVGVLLEWSNPLKLEVILLGLMRPWLWEPWCSIHFG